MYSVEITVERDKVTGETRVLSSNTKLPVDLSHQGVKVYEDEQKGDVSQLRDFKSLLEIVEFWTGLKPQRRRVKPQLCPSS